MFAVLAGVILAGWVYSIVTTTITLGDGFLFGPWSAAKPGVSLATHRPRISKVPLDKIDRSRSGQYAIYSVDGDVLRLPSTVYDARTRNNLLNPLGIKTEKL